ncbi:MAG TPA: hypothetical protein VE640_05070 [Candidatus Bathyarchaeia archaeon]|nr:hypothetical protein [Candidatus Bathyarchaeia archaeon]
MADTKISDLTAATTAATANELPINEAGTSKKLTVDLLQQFLGLTKKRLTADHAISSTTATKVTDLDATLVPGTYRFTYYMVIQSATTTVGLVFGVNFSGTKTRFNAMLTWPDTGVTAALGAVDDAANAATGQVVAHAVTGTVSTTTGNLSTGTTGVATANTDCFVKIEGVIIVSVTGDLQLYHGSETATSTTVMAGSSLEISRVP